MEISGRREVRAIGARKEDGGMLFVKLLFLLPVLDGASKLLSLEPFRALLLLSHGDNKSTREVGFTKEN